MSHRGYATLWAASALLAALACGGWEDRPNSTAEPTLRDATEWPVYGGTDSLQFSPLDQINRQNVGNLEVAWTYRTGDVATLDEPTGPSSFQATPILVGGVLYFPTPMSRVIALDPATGAEVWTFDPGIDRSQRYSVMTSRGVASWADPTRAPGSTCARRILFASLEATLYALDAATGLPCPDFGEAGQVDLNPGAGELLWRGEYGVTSPPAIIGDIAVVGALVSDNVRTDAPSGVVRAFDVRSGALRWAFDLAPPGFDYATRPTSQAGYALGTPNVWAPMAVDAERDLVFVPTGNPAPDYHRGGHPDMDHYGSSVVALRGSTGEVVWSFQTVHDDLWDYDVPAQPTLIDLDVDGEKVPALVQGTKMGFLFVLNRETGEPLFGVEERPVPQAGATEPLSPTQPFPVKPPPLHPTHFEPWGLTFWDRGKCEEALAGMRFEGIYTPPGIDWSITYPAPTGGINWGGVAIDPDTKRLYVNTGDIPLKVRLLPRAEYEAQKEAGFEVSTSPQTGTPFAIQREPWIELVAPCNPPPWGRISAVDLVKGEIVWEQPLGKLRDFTPIPLDIGIGLPSLGGPLVTRGGLIFIGAAPGHLLRGFDVDSGEELWRGALPAGAHATPMTYALRGEDGETRQFVVVAAGGHWAFHDMGDILGDTLVAFALPE